MSDTRADETQTQEETAALRAFAAADLAVPFGPSFFLRQLGRFVRDRCPDPKERMPVVEVHLGDAGTLTVCHIVGVAPRWVVLAARVPGGDAETMAIECVPFALINRVSIHSRRPSASAVGFHQPSPPSIVAAETLLKAAMPQVT